MVWSRSQGYRRHRGEREAKEGVMKILIENTVLNKSLITRNQQLAADVNNKAKMTYRCDHGRPDHGG